MSDYNYNWAAQNITCTFTYINSCWHWKTFHMWVYLICNSTHYSHVTTTFIKNCHLKQDMNTKDGEVWSILSDTTEEAVLLLPQYTGRILAFEWRDRGKQHKTSVKVVGWKFKNNYLFWASATDNMKGPNVNDNLKSHWSVEVVVNWVSCHYLPLLLWVFLHVLLNSHRVFRLFNLQQINHQQTIISIYTRKGQCIHLLFVC